MAGEEVRCYVTESSILPSEKCRATIDDWPYRDRLSRLNKGSTCALVQFSDVCSFLALLLTGRPFNSVVSLF